MHLTDVAAIQELEAQLASANIAVAVTSVGAKLMPTRLIVTKADLEPILYGDTTVITGAAWVNKPFALRQVCVCLGGGF